MPSDTTTVFAGYLKTLRAASPGKDITTLVKKDQAAVQASVDAVSVENDLNTTYARYLGSSV